MKNVKDLLILLFLLCIVSVSSYGQFTGPGTTDTFYTVKDIKDNASRLDRADIQVKVQGKIIKQLNKDTFEFEDSTGTIKVEIKSRNLPSKPFNEKTLLILIGEVDYDLLEGVEIEVDNVEFAP